MTRDVRAQYEAFPYPERDPKDEANRLITGSPSHPVEIDHHLYSGTRDWSQPFRALIAGGGTGDALVQLAQVLTTAGKPYEITYLDQSKASREIAEARIAARKLTDVTFVTGDLLSAADHGPFDYIDCCGVLHHLPDPVAGLSALRGALAPNGGLGFMVYAPHGRSGVYPLQAAFGTLLDGKSPEERLALAKQVLPRLPETHPFRRNGLLADHLTSDAGLFDLLLHSQDRPYTIREWALALHEAGFELASTTAPALYDLSMLTKVPEGMDPLVAMETAEALRGTIRKHVGYAHLAGEARAPAQASTMSEVPHLAGNTQQLASNIAKGATVKMAIQGSPFSLKLPQSSASVISRINGRRTVAEIAQASKLDAIQFQQIWTTLQNAFVATGTLTYSRLYRD